MTDLIQEIEKAIEKAADTYHDENYTGIGKFVWSKTEPVKDFKSGASFILPLLKKAILCRDEYLNLYKRKVYISKETADKSQAEESEELNLELLKLLGSEK